MVFLLFISELRGNTFLSCGLQLAKAAPRAQKNSLSLEELQAQRAAQAAASIPPATAEIPSLDMEESGGGSLRKRKQLQEEEIDDEEEMMYRQAVEEHRPEDDEEYTQEQPLLQQQKHSKRKAPSSPGPSFRGVAPKLSSPAHSGGCRRGQSEGLPSAVGSVTVSSRSSWSASSSIASLRLQQPTCDLLTAPGDLAPNLKAKWAAEVAKLKVPLAMLEGLLSAEVSAGSKVKDQDLKAQMTALKKAGGSRVDKRLGTSAFSEKTVVLRDIMYKAKDLRTGAFVTCLHSLSV